VLLVKVARRVNDRDVWHWLKRRLKAAGKRGVPQGGVNTPPTIVHTFFSTVVKLTQGSDF
jgi:hypothetical protein